ncbi:MAG: dihydroorotate dehydrogenase [Candidatus Acetothermia bacterium]
MDLSVEIAGVQLENPLMPAAGPITGNPNVIARVAKQGVGCIVTKTVSTEAAEVPRPSVARLSSGILNCEKWAEEPPSKWIEDYYPEIVDRVDKPIIVSLGYEPDQLEELIPKVHEFADAFELSSHYLGHNPDPIREIAATATRLTDKPVLIKLSPHVPDLKEFAQAAVDGGASGIVAINSLGPGLQIDLETMDSTLGSDDGYGWLSGPPIKHIALRAVNEIYNAVDVPVIGVGGISTARDLLEFVAAGATGTQMLSAALSDGSSKYGEVLENLPKELEKLGKNSVEELIGAYKQ